MGDEGVVVGEGVVMPSVDLGPFMAEEGVVVGDPPTAAQTAAAQKINATCKGHGFMHITNWGLSGEMSDEAFAAAEELFALPEEEKLKLNRITPETNRGYAPFKCTNLNRSRPPDLLEAFNVRFEPAHANDFRGCPERFVNVARQMLGVIEKAAKRYGLACALALGLERDYFVKTMHRMDLCTMRYLHYPPCDSSHITSSDRGVSQAVRVGEHTDFGAYTFLLLPKGALGLQIKPVGGGEVGGQAGGEGDGWLDVLLPTSVRDGGGKRARRDAAGALVNTGALMARWTNDYWKATAHRVMVPDLAAASQHRYSIACFIDPDASAKVSVDPRFVEEGEEAKYPETTGLDFLLMKLRECQQEKGIKA